MKAILVMLSNYFHDLAVAILFCSMLLTWYLHKAAEKEREREVKNRLVTAVVKGMNRVALAAWAWITVGGIIRTLNYYEYEWLPAAGRGQITALVVKHLLLVGITVYGATIQYKLYHRYLKE